MDFEPKGYRVQAVLRGLELGGISIGDPMSQPRYPFWLYKDGFEPLQVKTEEEEKNARADGYDVITAGQMANKCLVNWFWDLEDFSPKQLRVFAKEEFEVDLPAEASQDTLFKAVVELTKNAPQNRNRIVMMAHTIHMNYDATIEEIKRLSETPGDANVEYFSEEFMA